MRSLDLDVEEARGLFKLIDIDDTNEVGIEEFVTGCVRLKGNAKSIDLATLMYENKRMVQQFSGFFDYATERFDKLEEILSDTERHESPKPSIKRVRLETEVQGTSKEHAASAPPIPSTAI